MCNYELNLITCSNERAHVVHGAGTNYDNIMKIGERLFFAHTGEEIGYCVGPSVRDS